ncbi:MOSC domain-containing protein [Quadrisphaera sp. INWT6]|uniref:MOSC domain-containing protein n=1 Tax=Quadrisphaera sp. INWT6 TaxID=2596917 RepID=UPI00189284E0|nr:MOSC domain-containing protein [Quadrisphaera sp. INWT6]
MSARVDGLFVYPVKGLTPQPLDDVLLEPGRAFPSDRVLALARPDGPYAPGLDHGISKRSFYVLVAEARLAGLDTHLDPATQVLTADVRGHRVLTADLSREAGREDALSFFARVLDLPDGVRPVLARDAGRRFTDCAPDSDRAMEFVSVINLASVADLARRVGAEVDPLRFRGNVHLAGLPAWEELGLVGREFTLGGVRLRGMAVTERCAATEVRPGSPVRDLPVPRLLVEHYGHAYMGVYAEVVDGGRLARGDVLERGGFAA